MHRYFLELAYNGTRYHGWQIQPGVPTIQEELETNLSKITRQKVAVTGAGRTDTGVHASFFTAHFDLNESLNDTDRVTYKLNKMLSADIRIMRTFAVANDLHARFDANFRTYYYYVSKYKNPFAKEIKTQYPFALDVEKMNEAAKILFEYIDFTSFSKLHTQVKTNNCKIFEAEWTESETTYTFMIKADRFLRNMVRAIVGTMFEIGREKLTCEDFRKIIESKDRSAAGTSAPPQGLFLADIGYPEGSGVNSPKADFAETIRFL